MKALACGRCGDIRALDPDPSHWVTCCCGNVSARWLDPERGKAEFAAHERGKAYLLGLNNRLLVPALQGQLAMFEDFRHAHDRATEAPNHVFDKSRAGCWAVVVKVGATGDVTWLDGPPPVPHRDLDHAVVTAAQRFIRAEAEGHRGLVEDAHMQLLQALTQHDAPEPQEGSGT